MRGFALGSVGVGIAVAVLAALALTPGPTVAALLWPVLVPVALGLVVLAVVARRRRDVVDGVTDDGGTPSADPFGLLGDPRVRDAARHDAEHGADEGGTP